jgi:hypothetical protein
VGVYVPVAGRETQRLQGNANWRSLQLPIGLQDGPPSVQEPGHDLEAARLEACGRSGEDQRGDPRGRGCLRPGRVTHHQRVLRANLKDVEREREHAHVRLLDPVLERQNHSIEEVGDAVRGEYRAQIEVKVADEGDGDAACLDLSEDGLRVGIERVVGWV